MTMLPGQPRRPVLPLPHIDPIQFEKARPSTPYEPVPTVSDLTGSGVIVPSPDPVDPIVADLIRDPVPATRREPLQLSANMAALVALAGGLVILFSELDGLGFIPAGARTPVALAMVALLPLAVLVAAFTAAWKARKP